MIPPLVGVLPAVGWVAERPVEGGDVFVAPLVGWGIDAAGQAWALPASFVDGWTVRPQVDGDDTRIRRWAQSLRAGASTAGRVLVDSEIEGLVWR